MGKKSKNDYYSDLLDSCKYTIKKSIQERKKERKKDRKESPVSIDKTQIAETFNNTNH